MKYELIIDTNQEESITIIAHEKTKKIIEIENLINELNIVGYSQDETRIIDINDVICFFTKDNAVFLYIEDKEYKTKLRIYQVEEMVTSSFIKINQGCIANISKIDRFKTSFGGSVQVIFNNGYIDYISRRELQNVKRRLGIWKNMLKNLCLEE